MNKSIASYHSVKYPHAKDKEKENSIENSFNSISILKNKNKSNISIFNIDDDLNQVVKKKSSRNAKFMINEEKYDDIEYSIEKTQCHRKLNSNLTLVSFFDEEQRVDSYQTIVNNQKLLIWELRKQNRIISDKNHRLNYINKLSKDEDTKTKEHTVIFYEDKITQLEKIIKEKDKYFQTYEEKMLKDFAYKENKILEQYNIVSELEDEKMRLIQIINISKDKDKKKYLEVENKVKLLSKEMQRVNLFII